VFNRPDHPLEIIPRRIAARQRVTLPASSYAHIRQVVWVQSGALVTSRLRTASARHGDCLGFGPPAEVTFANERQHPALTSLALARS